MAAGEVDVPKGYKNPSIMTSSMYAPSDPSLSLRGSNHIEALFFVCA